MYGLTDMRQWVDNPLILLLHEEMIHNEIILHGEEARYLCERSREALTKIALDEEAPNGQNR